MCAQLVDADPSSSLRQVRALCEAFTEVRLEAQKMREGTSLVKVNTNLTTPKYLLKKKKLIY